MRFKNDTGYVIHLQEASLFLAHNYNASRMGGTTEHLADAAVFRTLPYTQGLRDGFNWIWAEAHVRQVTRAGLGKPWSFAPMPQQVYA
jgi:hypothetical protein